MKNVLPLLALIAGALIATGCPKNVETTVAGTDEEQLDRYAARLEELRVRAQAENPSCNETCEMRTEACDLAKKVCDISARVPSAQDRCVVGNEDCARFNDACASCSG